MITDESKLRIRHAFPATTWQDVDVVVACLDPIYNFTDSEVSPDSIGPILLDGEELSIPSRVYLLDPESDRISGLTNFQQLLLSAILSRCSNGYVREKYVRNLLQADEPWIPPFVVQLLGEYVLPIIRVVEEHSAVLERETYRRFIIENPAFFQLLKQRTISYWNCYYRDWFPQLKDYPAFQMLAAYGQ